MIITADLANAVSKVNPIFLEGTLKVAAADAKTVGLRDGQIVQAVIENRGDHTKLLIGNKEFELPKNMHVGESSKFQAKVTILNNGSAVLNPAGVSISGGNSPPTFLPLSPHFMNLLLHSSGFGNLLSVYSSGFLSSISAHSGLTNIITKILGLRLNLSTLTASDLKAFILNFGLFNEAVLSKRQKLGATNQKVLLVQLVRMLTERGIDPQSVNRAILDIEASQLETNQSLQNREIFFSLMLPFKDFGGIDFSFSKIASRNNDKDSPYTFNLHTKNESLGEIWLRVVVEKRINLNMQMWATDKQTYTKAKDGFTNLNRLLSDAGLNISAFEIFNEEKPGEKEMEKEKKTLGENIMSGSKIDVEA